MSISNTTRWTLIGLKILAWVIFVGLSVEAGAIIVNTFITAFINPEGVNNFWEGKEYFIALQQFDKGYFLVITIIMIIVAVLKAILFYLIIMVAENKDISISKPFSADLKNLIIKMAFLATGIAIFSGSGVNYAEWLHERGMLAPDIRALHFEGADIWFFMAVIFFILGIVVQKGIEIQNENELTI